MLKVVLVFALVVGSGMARATDAPRSGVVVLTAAPPPDTKCSRAFHLRLGDAAPCEGDLLPVPEVLRLLEIEDALALAKAELEASKALAEIEAQKCTEQVALHREARRECEEQCAPPPVIEASTPPRIYERWSFWVGAAVVAATITTGAVLEDDHKLLYLSGGIGLATMVSGAF